MMRFQFAIIHVPGKNLTVADALSRAPVDEARDSDQILQEEEDAFVDTKPPYN